MALKLKMPSERKLVVTFDICSSTIIIEQLLKQESSGLFADLLRRISTFLDQQRERVPFSIYKFTGDGWILLFPETVDGNKLIDFLRRLCAFYEGALESRILSVIESQPANTGLTFGMEAGTLAMIIINKHTEYIGRALNIACRLQKSIKDKDSKPAYKALITNAAFRKYLADVDDLTVKDVRRTLSNVNDGAPFHCKKFNLARTKKS